MSAASEKLDDWLNKEAVTEDDITAFPLTALAATLYR
jgi:3-methylfumaryl-CoA hydratase